MERKTFELRNAFRVDFLKKPWFSASCSWRFLDVSKQDAAVPSSRHGLCSGFGWFPPSAQSRSGSWCDGLGQSSLHSLLVRTADGRSLPNYNHKPITSWTRACYVYSYIYSYLFSFLFWFNFSFIFIFLLYDFTSS